MDRRITWSLAVAAVAIGACSSQPAAPTEGAADAAQRARDYSPVVSLNEIMVYIVDPHSNEIWDAALTPPTTDEAWAELQRAAVVLAASGNLTKLSGNGPKDQAWTEEPGWIVHSQAVADAGLSATRAVRARDLTALAEAGDALVVSCINCHREYRLDVPSIWTERQFPPGAGGQGR